MIAIDPEIGRPAVVLVLRDDQGNERIAVVDAAGGTDRTLSVPADGLVHGPAAAVDLYGDGSPDLVWSGGSAEGTGAITTADIFDETFISSDRLDDLGNQDVSFAVDAPDGNPIVLTAAGAFDARTGHVIAGWPSDNQSGASLVRVWSDPAPSRALGLGVATSTGLWSARTGGVADWDDGAGLDFAGGQVDGNERSIIVHGGGRRATGRDAKTGATLWQTLDVSNAYRIAAGDVDGDGAPEVCCSIDNRVTLLTGRGDVIWQGAERGHQSDVGGCALADLDGDGSLEVVDLSRSGVTVFDGAGGDVLWADPTVAAMNSHGSPAIAWLGEEWGTVIAVVVARADEADTPGILGHILRVYAGAAGAWAPTRSFWPGPNYAWRDFRDDNTVSWLAHANYPRAQSFRAQPALVGDLPDLTPVVVDQTSKGDLRRLVVAIANRGTVDSEAGATVTARTLIDSAWVDVASARVEDPVPVGWMSGGVRLDLPVEALGDSLIVEVTPANTAFECNPDDDAVVVDDPR